jgi:hypothetical protein
MKNSNDTIGNRSRVLPVCSAVPHPLRHRVPLPYVNSGTKSGGQVLQPKFHLMSAFTPSQWLDIRSVAKLMNCVRKGSGVGSLPFDCGLQVRINESPPG